MSGRVLYMTPRSPFARKIRLLLADKGLEWEDRPTDLFNAPAADFTALGPLRKVPILVEPDGEVVIDSSCIAAWLEEVYPSPPMMPASPAGRNRCRKLEELADTLTDQAVAIYLAGMRDDGGHPRAIERSRALIDRILDWIEPTTPEQGWFGGGERWDVGDISLVCALTYLTFRLGPTWKESRPRLAAWEARVAALPHVAPTAPRL